MAALLITGRDWWQGLRWLRRDCRYSAL